MLQQFEFAKVAGLEALVSVSHVDAEPWHVGADGATYDTLIERFVQAVSHPDRSGSPEPEVMKAVRFTGHQYSRSAKKELNRKAKTQHKAWRSTLTLAQTASSMSWHIPGQATCMISDIESIKVSPEVQVLYEDWTSHCSNDPHFQPHWNELRVNKYVEIQGKSYTPHHGKVRTEGCICVPFACVKQVIKACHEYAHPEVDKTLQIFNRSYVCFGYKPDDIRTMVASVVNPCPICGQMQTQDPTGEKEEGPRTGAKEAGKGKDRDTHQGGDREKVHAREEGEPTEGRGKGKERRSHERNGR